MIPLNGQTGGESHQSEDTSDEADGSGRAAVWRPCLGELI
ncbi:hypothetical protein NSERUTF1_1898 [Nocardia seriolae]|nr:hypothetical protein NSERUTF1_1898 [Nocardia seriolae]